MGSKIHIDVANDEDGMIELVVTLLRRLKEINGPVFYKEILSEIGLEEKEE